MPGFFGDIDPIRFEGRDSANPFAFRHYDADETVMGTALKDHLRFAAAYWHSLAWEGGDPFGGPTFERPWHPQHAPGSMERKAEAAFEMFRILGVPYFCWHDLDVRPEAGSFAESRDALFAWVDLALARMEETGVKCLWGTANMFTHRRWMAGAATNPDPDVFAYAAATVKSCIDATKRLGGENYVLWGGREGYETLLNTDMARERRQAGRFLQMVVEYARRTGFDGAILVEPKPQEPSKHQYDFDVATVYGFLKDFGLEGEVKVNIEQGHAILAGHSFEHELHLARGLGILGSIDMNRNDYQSGWDTDQFPNSVPEVALAYYEILKAGGLAPGGTNFDARIRRQSIDPEDLILSHVGAMDVCAAGLKAAARMLEDGEIERLLAGRYAAWDGKAAKSMLEGGLEAAARPVEEGKLDPEPRSGGQERLEMIVSRYVS